MRQWEAGELLQVSLQEYAFGSSAFSDYLFFSEIEKEVLVLPIG